MTLHNHLQGGSTPHEAPEMTFEVEVNVPFDPRLDARRMKALGDRMWERLRQVLREEIRPFLSGRPDPDVTARRGLGEETPLFPMVAGESRFTMPLDVSEQVARYCAGSDVSRIAHDALGRAYELDVEVTFLRRPQHDGERTAPLPDPDEVEANSQARAAIFDGRRGRRHR